MEPALIPVRDEDVEIATDATIPDMSTREKVEHLLDRLSEAQLEAEYKRLSAALDDEGDGWGSLEAWGEAASRRTFDHLDEEEAAIGFDWGKYR